MKIFKYSLRSFDCIIEMPIDAAICHVDDQNGNITLWAKVSDYPTIGKRHFKVFSTGANIDKGEYIGTVLQVDGAFVWHVFELV